MSKQLVRIAHRGGGALAADNSLEGILRTLEYGIEMIELDVRRTRDGALVLSHDESAHSSGMRIAGSSFDELRAGCAQPVVLLEEALEAVRGKARLNLDIKDVTCAETVVELVRRHNAAEHCIVSCLTPACLVTFQQLEPTIPRFLSYPHDHGGASQKKWLTPFVNAAVAAMRASLPMRLPAMARQAPGSGVTIYYKLVTPRLVSVARKLGIPLYTWTVDDPADMRRMIARGVDGITSNRPDLLANLASTSTAPELAPSA